MKIKKFSLMAVALMATTMLAACGDQKEEQVTPTPEGSETTETTELTKLSFGVMSSIDVVPLIIAQDQGYFTEEGIDLDLQVFAAAKDREDVYKRQIQHEQVVIFFRINRSKVVR